MFKRLSSLATGLKLFQPISTGSVWFLHVISFTQAREMLISKCRRAGTVVVYIWAMAWDFQPFGMCDQQRLRPAWAYAQTDQRLCWSLKYSMTVKLLIETHLRFLSLKGGCTGLSESTPVKIAHCWESRVVAKLWSSSGSLKKIQRNFFYSQQQHRFFFLA